MGVVSRMMHSTENRDLQKGSVTRYSVFAFCTRLLLEINTFIAKDKQITLCGHNTGWLMGRQVLTEVDVSKQQFHHISTCVSLPVCAN